MQNQETIVTKENSSGIYVRFGLHNKSQGNLELIEENNYPVNLSSDQEVFAITPEGYFTAGASATTQKVESKNVYIKFLKFIRVFLYFLLVPGIFFGALKLLDYTEIVEIPTISIFSPLRPFNQLLFWISVLGAQVLWYDLFFEHQRPKEKLEVRTFTVNEVSKIQNNQIDFTAFIKRTLAQYIHNLSSEILAEATENGMTNIGILWQELMQLENLHKTFKRIHPLDEKNLPISEQDIVALLGKYQIPVHEFVLYSLEEASILKDNYILPEHLFLTIWKLIPELKELLYQQNFTQEDMRLLGIWVRNIEKQKENYKYWKPENRIKKTGGIFADWAYGYTFYLNKFSTDLTEEAIDLQTEFGIGHISETSEIISALGKSTQGNILLIGDSGVGKTSIIKGLAQRIVSGNVPEDIRDLRIISINVSEMIANAPKFGGIEGITQKTIEEAISSGNIILFIDEIHTLIGTQEGGVQAELSNLMTPHLSNANLKIIGTTTYQDFKTKFDSGGSLSSSFDIIEVNETSTSDTIRILETFIPKFEREHQVFITFSAMKNAVILSQKYIQNQKLPNKAISILEEASVRKKNSSTSPDRVVTLKDIQETISEKTSIPVSSIGEKESKELLELEEKMRAKVIGQGTAITAAVEALKRSRSGISREDKPIAVFLFMGPTGVGKTHVAKTLSELYFGGQKNMIRLDMSEFQAPDSINRIIGSSSNTRSETTTLADFIKRSPHTLVLLDELEKAHPDLLNVFLQLFDEGRLTTSAGETVDFTNTIIIATSNVGTLELQTGLSEGLLFQDAEKRALLALNQAFRPEFLNRFDKIIIFKPLSKEDLTEIAKLQLNTLAARLAEQGLHMTYTDQVPAEIAKVGTSEYGAREINRVIQTEIEQKIANLLIEKKISKGDKVEVNSDWIGGAEAHTQQFQETQKTNQASMN